jgi:hypothetical protein
MRHFQGLAIAVLAAIGATGCGSDAPSTADTGGASSAGSGGVSGGGAGTTGVSGSATGGSSSGNANASGSGGTDMLGGSNAGGSAGQTAGGNGGTPAGGGGAGPADPHPLLAVLAKFTAPDVPARGPMEAAPNPRNFNGTPPALPGKGLAQHPMLFVGENYNRIQMVNDGKLIWTYDTNGRDGVPWELDDIWLLSNGNVLYSHQTYIEEVTPTKQVVWHYDTPGKVGDAEIHTCQPIGLDKVVVVMNGQPSPKLMIFNTKTNTVELEHLMPDGNGSAVHGQVRRMRVTPNGNYLIAWIGNKKVVEYDKDFNTVWTYATPRPWSVARLLNGNTLIQDETETTCKEVDPQGNVVWSLKKSELGELGNNNANNQTCERLASGNTVMFNHDPSSKFVQAVEVTKDKQVVWALQDYANLGDATSAQFLDEPGIPEVLGGTQH